MSDVAQARWLEGAARLNSRPPLNLVNASLWFLVVIYGAARLLQIFPGKVPMIGVVAFHVLPPLIFALVHGSLIYRLRAAVLFVVLFLVIGNVLEDVSVLTGFPFGHYYFTELMGPKVFHVPIFLGLAYVGMAYLAWILANLILGTAGKQITGRNIVLLPLLASLIMTSWDLSQDPVWSTYLHLWIWPHGGIYFGVPVGNFVGWLFTVYVIYQVFTLYLRTSEAKALSVNYFRAAISFYAISAAGNLLPLARAGNLVAVDPSGASWSARDLVAASAFVSVFVMGTFSLWAWLKISRPDGATP